MKVVNVVWIISSTLLAYIHLTPVAANEIQEELKAIDQKITNRIWKNMIWSFIDYEKKNFKRK